MSCSLCMRFNLIVLIMMVTVTACNNKQIIFPPVMDALTRGYCGTCHMAYQPSMLPTASWQLMMGELDDHFNEKVALSLSAITHIRAYLIANAGDTEAAGEAGRVALSGLERNSNLQRISAAPYFKREHRFLENRILDEWVGSVANCPACHVGAWVGDYKM